MVDYLRRPVQHEAFFKKYASKKFLKGMSSLSTCWVVTDKKLSFDRDKRVGEKVPLTLPSQQTQCLTVVGLLNLNHSRGQRNTFIVIDVSSSYSPIPFFQQDQNLDEVPCTWNFRRDDSASSTRSHRLIAPYPSIFTKQQASWHLL